MLWITPQQGIRRIQWKGAEPLLRLRVDRVRMHCNLREERMEQPQQSRIPSAQCLLEERRPCQEPSTRHCQYRTCGLPFAASRAFFSRDRPNDAQNVVLGRFSRTFIASSRKTTSVTGSRLILSTFSSVYTLTQQSAISSMRLSRLPHSAAVHCGAVTLVGSVRTRDLYKRPCPIEVDSVRGGYGMFILLQGRRALTHLWP